ncbi:MAG: hypothetical protein FWE57_05680 [Chitinispirillia bacterium]|nr:hypothetical protein [Chitinispirillia bacterium]
MSDTQREKRYKSRSGGVALRVIICAVSLLAAGAVIVFTLRSFESKKAEDYRIALMISEHGLQTAFEKLAQSSDWIEGFSKEPYEGGSFDVDLERQTRDDIVYLRIISRGTMGSVTQIKECVFRLEVSEGDSTWIPEGMR